MKKTNVRSNQKQKNDEVKKLEKIYFKYLIPMSINEWKNVTSLKQPSLLKQVPTKTTCSSWGEVLKEISDGQKNGKNLDDIRRCDQKLQDLVLTVHHCCMHALVNTTAFKIIENHIGSAYVKAQA